MMSETATQEPVKLNELNKLAKLMATENIRVEHRNVAGPFFETDRRVLVLPIWKNISRELYHMLTAHEISHALNTPPEGWRIAIQTHKKPNVFKDYLNVVEDARIERMIKETYPGTRRDFREAYEQLVDRDFFKLFEIPMHARSLIDRLNLHFKIGNFTAIPFTDEERVFISAMERTRTFADVEAVSIQIYDYAKAKQQERKEEEKEGKKNSSDEQGKETGSCSSKSSKEESDEEYDGERTPSSSNNTEQDEEENSPEGDSSDDESGDEEEDAGANQDDEEELKAQTVEDLAEGFQSLVDNTNNQKTLYCGVDSFVDHREYVVPFRATVDYLRKHCAHSLRGEHFTKHQQENSTLVNYLVKEFEMRKAAKKYERARESKTGVINPNKLHAYKLIDDVFRRNMETETGKNHGIVMFIDFSGSMNPVMHETITQLVNLVSFCRKVNIPHRVYAFSDRQEATYPLTSPVANERHKRRHETMKQRLAKSNMEMLIVANPDLNLIELFSDKMKASEFRDMTESLLFSYADRYNHMKPKMFELGGTPLDGAIVLAMNILPEFKKETGAELISAVFLTDGESSPAAIESKNTGSGAFGYTTTSYKEIQVFNPRNGKYYLSKTNRYYGNTDTLLRIVADQGFNVIGYRVINSTRDLIYLELDDSTKIVADIRKHKCGTINNISGYDQLNVIMMQKADRDKFASITEEASKGQITRAFINSRNNRLNQRVILLNFAKKISVSH